MSWANGFWGLDETDWDDEDYKERNCKDSPVEIRVDTETGIYWSRIGNQDPRTAAILDVTADSLTIQYDNETRLMDDGSPHIWTISFVDRNKFYWIREDWKIKGPKHKTAARYRCNLAVA